MPTPNPMLPTYTHLVGDPDPHLDFLYGGRDSGKSYAIAQTLIHLCVSDQYFRCVLVRKVLENIKDSQWQLIKDIVEKLGLSHLFSFTKTPLEITYLPNNNKFIARGCDNPQNLKSITNPSCCWIEEGNQLSEEEFTIIQSTLRCNDRQVRIFFSFNPEYNGDYTTFWLYKQWFSHTTALSFTSNSYRATHTTYHSNPFVTPQRKAVYESYAVSNSYYYSVYTLGQWGYRTTGGGFWKHFNAGKHVRHITADPDKPIHIVVDNNVNPYVTIALWQINDHELRQVHELTCTSPDNNAPRAAALAIAWLKSIDFLNMLFVYGDPSANSRTTIDENCSSFFDKFIKTLRKADYYTADRVQRSAPEVALSGAFINEIYATGLYGYNITIGTTCRTSIEDYTMTKENAAGGILKKRTTDKETGISYEKYGHFSDAKRYFITTALKDEFDKFTGKEIRPYGIYRVK